MKKSDSRGAVIDRRLVSANGCENRADSLHWCYVIVADDCFGPAEDLSSVRIDGETGQEAASIVAKATKLRTARHVTVAADKLLAQRVRPLGGKGGGTGWAVTHKGRVGSVLFMVLPSDDDISVALRRYIYIGNVVVLCVHSVVAQ